jgi:hypothetical protein
VFGVSSDECLDYAIQNRDEWIVKGEALVEQMKEEFQRGYSRKGSTCSQEPANRFEPTNDALDVSNISSYDFESTTTDLTDPSLESSSAWSLTILVDEFGTKYFDF